MNVLQVTSLARIVIVFLGGMAVAKGLVTQDMVDHLSDTVFLTQIIGGAAAVGAAVYGVWMRSRTNIVKTAAALPDVAKIETYDPKLAESANHKVVAKDTGI